MAADENGTAIDALKREIGRLTESAELLRKREKEALEDASGYRNAALPIETRIGFLKASIIKLGGMP